MIIRVLSELCTQAQWLAFRRRETPYCFVRDPECLVDFQSNFLALTLLQQGVRNGKQAIKYSLGARHSDLPAWRFISRCNYDLELMVTALESLHFGGSVRDYPMLGDSELSIRKFFAKDRAVISPSTLGSLEPVTALPRRWTLNTVCRLLANQQVTDLRNESLALPTTGEQPWKGTGKPASAGPAAVPETAGLLLQLVEEPDAWRAEVRGPRLFLLKYDTPRYSLRPCPKPVSQPV